MKKTYMMPTLTVVNVKMGNLLTGSPDVTYNNTDADPIEADKVEVREHHSIWDEEE